MRQAEQRLAAIRADQKAQAPPSAAATSGEVAAAKSPSSAATRTEEPVQRIQTKILEVVIEFDGREALLPGLHVVSVIDDRSLN